MSLEAYDNYCCFRNKDKNKVRLLWELTTRCNENCKFCHTKHVKELNTKELLSIFPKIKNLNIKDIIFTGGEPLLRSDLFEILEYAKKEGYELDLCTNGTLVNKDVASELKKYLSEISVSLDAHLQILNDDIRGKDNGFNLTIQGIKNMVECGMQVHLITVVTKKNFLYISEICKLAEELNVHSITFLGLISDYSRDNKYAQKIDIDEEERKIVQDKISYLRKSNLKLIINSKRIYPEKKFEKCSAGKGILGITAEGYMLPCILLRDSLKYNLLEVNVCEINFKNSYNILENKCLK